VNATVRETQPAPPAEPSPWLDLAAEFRRVADDLETLVGEPAPGLVSIDIQPQSKLGRHRPPRVQDRAEIAAAVDRVAVALLGRAAATKRMGSTGNTFHHTVDGERGTIGLNIYQAVADPNLVDPAEEIARLRAENERLRAEAAGQTARADADQLGLNYTRADDEADEPTTGGDQAREVLAVAPVSPARVPLHYGVVDDKAPETDWYDETTGLVSGGLVPNCPTCGDSHHTVEPCR
jgi:hypothetical protein